MTERDRKAGAHSAVEAPLVQQSGPPLARRASKEDSTRPSDRIALGSALFGGLVAAVVVAARFAFSGGETRVNASVLAGISSTSQPVHVQAGAQAQSSNARNSAAGSATPPSDSSNVAHVANTGGQGVVLRASPREDDRTPRGFMDGDAVVVLERSGSDWARVRGDNGQEGWVPTTYLGP